jgi:hypothetical protein
MAIRSASCSIAILSASATAARRAFSSSMAILSASATEARRAFSFSMAIRSASCSIAILSALDVYSQNLYNQFERSELDFDDW